MLATWIKTNNTIKQPEGLGFVQAIKKQNILYEGNKFSPHEAIFCVSMKVEIATPISSTDCVVARNSTSNITTEEDFEIVIINNNERTSNIEDDEESDYEPTHRPNLELQGNYKTNETEPTYRWKMRPNSTGVLSKTPKMTTATISRTQKVKMFRVAVREVSERK